MNAISRIIFIAAAWGLGWIVYMVAVLRTDYEGFPSIILQPIMGALVTTLCVGISVLAGLALRIRRVGQFWRRKWLLAPAIAAASLFAMSFGTYLGWTEIYTNPETGSQFIGLRSDIGLASYLLMIFAVSNFPLPAKKQG